MFSILERNGEKTKGKPSLFSNFLITIVYTTDWTNSLLVEIFNVNTANSTWFENNFQLQKCHSIFKNIFNSDENVIIFSVLNYNRYSWPAQLLGGSPQPQVVRWVFPRSITSPGTVPPQHSLVIVACLADSHKCMAMRFRWQLFIYYPL